MKPFFVLILAFAISFIASYFFSGIGEFNLAGKVALSIMLLFTAIGHFAFTKGMMLMLPPDLPLKKEAVILIGIFEIAAAFAIFIPEAKTSTAWIVIVFFIVMLPANIYASAKNVNYQKATFDGPGLQYLWFRMPFQVLLIFWVILFIVRD